MGNFGLWIFVVLVIGIAVMVNGDETSGDNSPMNAVHDDAFEKMDKLKTINNGDACDATFTKKLKDIISEIENNWNATQEIANKLKKDFQDALDGQPDKKLCKVGITCNAAGTCEAATGSGQDNSAGSKADSRAATADSVRVIPANGPVTFILNLLLASLFVLVCSD